jgi:hypothetical protein
MSKPNLVPWRLAGRRKQIDKRLVAKTQPEAPATVSPQALADEKFRRLALRLAQPDCVREARRDRESFARRRFQARRAYPSPLEDVHSGPPLSDEHLNRVRDALERREEAERRPMSDEHLDRVRKAHEQREKAEFG